MLKILHDWWLESPPIHTPGFIAALIVAGLGDYLCLVKVRSKTWSIFLMSLAVALCCFVSLLIFAIIGILAVNAGVLGMARSWASFADAYVWGVFSLPFLTLSLCLAGFTLTNHSSRTR